MDSLTKFDPFKDWDPVRELDEFQNRLRSLFGRQPARRGREGMLIAEWAPSVDIIEDENEFVVKAELPEVKREDVHVTVENGILTIQGERMVFLRAASACLKGRTRPSSGLSLRTGALAGAHAQERAIETKTNRSQSRIAKVRDIPARAQCNKLSQLY